MMLYIYDIKAKDDYNRIKRMFYYQLRKMQFVKRRTKSVLLVDDDYERDMDEFFSKWEGNIEVYKGKLISLEKIFDTIK